MSHARTCRARAAVGRVDKPSRCDICAIITNQHPKPLIILNPTHLLMFPQLLVATKRAKGTCTKRHKNTLWEEPVSQ